jgi:flagellar motor protein MotB
MNVWNVNMLAADFDNVIGTLFLVAFALVSVIASATQKRKAEREREEAIERRRTLASAGSNIPPEAPPLTGQRLERAQQAMREQLGLAEPAPKVQRRSKRRAQAQPVVEPTTTRTVAMEATPVVAAPAAGAVVNLRSREQLRRAMLYHEILSPPKALRKTDEEMWNS